MVAGLVAHASVVIVFPYVFWVVFGGIRDMTTYFKLTFMSCVFYPAMAFSLPNRPVSGIVIGVVVLIVGLLGSAFLWKRPSCFLGVNQVAGLRGLPRRDRLRGFLLVLGGIIGVSAAESVISGYLRVPTDHPGLPDAIDALVYLFFVVGICAAFSARILSMFPNEPKPAPEGREDP